MSSRHGRGDGDEYGDYSPPPSYYSTKASSGSRSPAQRGSSRGGGGKAENEDDDVYNYDVGTGSSGGKKKKKKDKEKKPSSKPVTPVRKSQEDRIAEIMARHGVDSGTKGSGTSSPSGARASVEALHPVDSPDASGGEGDEPSSFRDFARDLMQLRASIGDPATKTSQEDAPTSKSPTPVVMATSPAVTPPRNRRVSQASEDSSDISDGDFEAGAYAKRVQQRKREEREAAQERAKALLAASPPPLREEDSPPPSPSPQRPQTTSTPFEMQDYDDTGVGRHGSPPPSYDMYGDDDDERAVGSRTPHHGDGGQEEEDGRYLMDHHEFDQSSGGESISPLYGGGLQRDEPMTHDSGRSPLNFDLSADSPMGGRPLGPNMARDEDTPLGSQLSSAFSAPSLRFEEGGGLHLTPVSSQGGRASMAYSDDMDTDDAPLPSQPSPALAPSTYSPAPSPHRDAAPSPSPSPSPMRTNDVSPPRAAQPSNFSLDSSAQGSPSPPPPPTIIGGAISSTRDTTGQPFTLPPPLTITALPPPPAAQSHMDDASEPTSRSVQASPSRPSLSPAPPSPSASRPLWGSTDSRHDDDGSRARVPSWAASPPPPSPPQDQQEQGHSDDASEEDFRQRHSDELEEDDRDRPASDRDEDVPPPPPPPPSTGGAMAIVSQPPLVPLQEVANGLRLLKGHSVTRVSDAQSFPGRYTAPSTVLLRGEGSPLHSPTRTGGYMHPTEEEDEEEAAGVGRGPLRGRAKAASDKSLQSKRRLGAGTQRGGAARGGTALGRGRGGASTSAPTTRSPAKTPTSGVSKRRASSAPGSRDSTPSRPTRRPASTPHQAPPDPPSSLHPREAEQMEREASLYEWERALEERVLRLELQERLLTKKELAVDRTSRSLQELQGSLEVELRSAAAVVANSAGPEGEAREEEMAKLREELDEARNETATLHTELDSLKARWEFVSGVDGALKAAADASASTTAGLRALRTQPGTRGGTQGQASGEEVLVSVADLSALRRDHEAQERLLEGFQKENERLVTQMTELKHAVARERRDMGREREAMHKEVNNLRNQLTGHGLATDSDRLQAGLRAEAQLRYLEEDIARERKANQERELELRYELDRLRQAKMDAELRGEGLNRQVLEEGDREVLRLEQMLREERAQYESELRSCRDKLKWYAENQELLEGHANMVAKQAEEISKLRRDLAEARRGGTQGGAAAKPGSKQEGMERRVKELEKQLVEMEQALQKRNPDCIASLIRATKGGGAEDGGQGGGKEGELVSRVKELEEELERRKESAQVMLRSLRQEHAKIKLGYAERLKRLEEGTVGPAGGGGKKGAAAKEPHPGRVKELEKELERVRAFYTKKVKEAERKAETQMRALKRGSISRAPAAPAPPSVRSARGSVSNAAGEGDKSPRLDLVEVGVATDEAELSPVAPSPSSADVEGQQRRLEKAETEVHALRRALQERDDELARLAAGAQHGREEAGPGVSGSVPAPPNIEWQKEQVRAVEEAVTRALERMNPGGAPAHPTLDPPPHRPSDPPVHATHPEVESLRRAQEALKDEVLRKDEQLGALKEGLGSLRAELQHLRTQQHAQHQQQQSQSNMMMSGMGDAHYQALAAQVVSLERRAANRERELSEMIETSASKHQLQVLLLRTEYEQQLAEKDEQIRRFREELDTLLHALEGLRDGRRRTGGAIATS